MKNQHTNPNVKLPGTPAARVRSSMRSSIPPLPSTIRHSIRLAARVPAALSIPVAVFATGAICIPVALANPIVAYAATTASGQKTSNGPTLDTTSQSTHTAIGQPTQALQDELKIGSTGQEVVTLQNDLNALGFSVGQADGQFGTGTMMQVEAFQKAHHLTVNGIVDSSTWNALNGAVAVLVMKPVALSSSSKLATNLELKHIYYNGKLITSPYGFTYTGTDYMPIWYVMNTMDKEGFTHTWSNNVWNIIVPGAAAQQIDYSNIKYGKGSMAIALNGTVVARVIGVTHVDPSSKQTTSFMPIWYVEQALKRVGIQYAWDGHTWKMTSSTPATGGSSGGTGGDGGSSASTVFGNVDLRFSAPGSITAQSINAYLSNSPYQGTIGSPMVGLGQSFMDAQKTYGVDATYLLAHAIWESGNGTSSIAQSKNNLFGYGAFSANPNAAAVFPSDTYAIEYQAWEVRNNYLLPGSSNYGGSPTLNGMSKNYASDANWAPSISSIMNEVASSVGSSVSDYPQYSPTAAATPAPSSTAEPVYYLNGATGVTQGDANYGGVPYYPTMSDGENDMFFSPLQNGSFGQSVLELQQFLNSQMNAGLTADGKFGPATQTAVMNFEASKGLPQDGIWSFSMWQTYVNPLANTPTLPAGESITVDEIEEGTAGGYVVPWYHIPNVGWIDSQEVQLANVYRVMAQSPLSTHTSIAVYSSAAGASSGGSGAAGGTQPIATLHSGDFVVSTSPTANNGIYEIQIALQSGSAVAGKPTGSLVTGYISANSATLVSQK